VILILFLLAVASVWVLSERIRKDEAELMEQKVEQRRLGEKLIISELLAKLELEVDNLKNEMRK